MTTLAGRQPEEITAPRPPLRPGRIPLGPLGVDGEPPVPRRRVKGLRTPPGVWRWWETAGVLAAVATVVAAALVIQPNETPIGYVETAAVVSHALALLASLLLYIHWRLAGGGPLAWLVLGLSSVCVHMLLMSGLAAAEPELLESRPGMVLLTQVLLGIGVLLVVYLARRGPTPDPLATGLVLGAALFLARYVLLAVTPHMHLGSDGLHRLALLAFLLDMTVAVGVAAFPKAPRWVRYRLALALTTFGLAHSSTYPVAVNDWDAGGAAVVGYVVGATVLLCVSVALVRLSIRDNRAAILLLREQLRRVEAVKRSEQAQLHEIRATLAGIQNASQIVHGYQALAHTRRARIREMIDAEIGRLARLTAPVTDEPPVAVAVAPTVEPLVVRLVTQGHRVIWHPNGAVALGRPDDVAEIVSVLLDNAVRHGGGREISLECRTRGRVVEIAVSDAGPGVPPDLRERIFEWGQSGPASTGDGIGLNVARTLSIELGGSLELLERESPGATFVLTLPRAGEERS